MDEDKRYTIDSKTPLKVFLIVCTLGMLYVLKTFGVVYAAAFAFAPLVVYLLVRSIVEPFWSFTLMFVSCYLVLGAARYVPSLESGIAIIFDGLLVLTLLSLIIKSSQKEVNWRRSRNLLLYLAIVWMVFCLLQLFNPSALPIAWFRTVRGVAVYFLLLVIITPAVIKNFKEAKALLYVFSALTLLAVGKAFMQRNIGFDPFEERWLYEGGGMSTHIIRDGVRYFSIYSDAGNFGAGMGMAMVVFSICAIYFKNKGIKFYFAFVAIAAAYGLIISGTRGALAVPFAGYTLYILLSKNKYIIMVGLVALAGAYVFLNHTYIGHGVSEIRRMRSAFNFEDKSFQVRLENQRLLREHMEDKPFGYGIGMGGVKAKTYTPNAELAQIPTDSWFVMIWVETGPVGLVLHIAILLIALIAGCRIALRLKNKELRGMACGVLAGAFGIMVASYGNEILGQLPTVTIVYVFLALVFVSPYFDKEISDADAAKRLS